MTSKLTPDSVTADLKRGCGKLVRKELGRLVLSNKSGWLTIAFVVASLREDEGVWGEPYVKVVKFCGQGRRKKGYSWQNAKHFNISMKLIGKFVGALGEIKERFERGEYGIDEEEGGSADDRTEGDVHLLDGG